MAAKAEKKAPPRPRRTKTEVQQQFEALREEVQAAPRLDAKAAAQEEAREEEVRAAVDGVDVPAVVQRIAALGLDVSRALADVTEKLTAEVRLLANLREAVEIERRELGRLHQIDVAATAIDQLIAEHAERKRALDAEIAEARTAWQAEAARVARERAEQEEAIRRQRQREEEDYEYKKAIARKKAQDKYEEEMRQLERRNSERQQALEADWARREAELKEREEEFARLQADVDAFPSRIASAVEGTERETRAEVEAEFERQLLVLRKDAEAEARVAALRIQSLEQTIATQAGRIETLERQLAEAKQQVQDIAVKAIEGASGARALSHVNQIAMEQAKNRPQS